MDPLELINRRMVATALLVLSSTLATAQINKQAPVSTCDTVFIDTPIEQALALQFYQVCRTTRVASAGRAVSLAHH